MKNRPSFLRRRPSREAAARPARGQTSRATSAASIEPLEARYAPATFAGTGGPGLTITLDHAGEAITIVATGATYTVTSNFTATDGGNTAGSVSGFGTATVAISAAAFTDIHIQDTANATSVAFGASGANAYSSGFDIVLDGLGAGLAFTGTSNFAGGLKGIATGNITQTAPVTSQAAAGVSLTSIAGTITLNDPANNFSVVSLETHGDNAISLRTSATLTLDHVTTQTGNLTITAGSGIGQTSTGRLEVGGTATFDVTGGANVSLSLASAPNFFGGPVIVTETGGDFGAVNLRNVSPTATLPDLSDLQTGDLSAIQIVFNGTGIALDAATETRLGAAATLTLTAGGPITQTAPITAGALNATVLGNHSITLTDAGNALTGAVSFNNAQADATSAVRYVENGAVQLGASSLGLGAFEVTALTGDISQAGAITQRLGALEATFTVTAGPAINLGTQANVFSGKTHLLGANVAQLTLRNVNTLAQIPDVADVLDTLTDLTLTFNNAPAVLPGLTVQNLTITADGIYQAPGTALISSGTADFNSSLFKLDLSNVGNDFATMRIRSTGREDVLVSDLNGLAFGGGNSDIGSGRLTITAGGAITQVANRLRQAPGAGPATFTGSSITLDRAANDFTGPLVLNTAGAATAADTNALVLGKAVVGGNLSITAATTIAQLAGSVLDITGTSVFTAGANSAVTLDNPGNALDGAVRFLGGNVVLRSAGAVSFMADNTIASLDVTAAGAITQQGGSFLMVGGTTTLHAGSTGIVLDRVANNFTGAVSITTTGPVTLGTTGLFRFGETRLGSANFSLSVVGDVTQVAGTSIEQSGPGTFGIVTDSNLILSQAGNDFRGPINIDANAVQIVSRHDVNFAATADISGNLTATAGGTITLPTAAGNLLDLGTVNLTAAKIVIGTSLTSLTGTGMTFNGATELASGVGITTTAVNGPVEFHGSVTALGALSFSVGTSLVSLQGGTWNQGSNNLTITSTGTQAFAVGVAADAPGVLLMGGGVLSLNVAAGGAALVVGANGVLHAGINPTLTESIGITTGAVNTGITFAPGSTLAIDYGTTHDLVVISTLGLVTIDGAHLVGSSAAAASPFPVLQVLGGGKLTGTFERSVAADGSAAAFLAGSDIVTASYLPTSVSVVRGGPAPAASFAGFLPDGDKYTVSHTGGVGAGLVVIENALGELEIAVRNQTVAGTLNVVTTRLSGDGLSEIAGIGVNGAGAITINAAKSDVHGDIRIGGPLSSLTVHDVRNAGLSQPQLIYAGGTASSSTKITGHLFDGVTIDLQSNLSALKVGAYISTSGAREPAVITAERFGTISATGEVATNLAGDFEARLVNRNTLHSPTALTSAVVANLSGVWDLEGAVGAVTATQTTSDWTLGASGPSATHLFGVASTGPLSLASVAGSTLTVNGALASLKVTSVEIANVTAGSVGSFSAVADPTKPDQSGGVVGLSLTVTGNKAGLAVGSFNVVASLQGGSLHFLDGNVGSFKVGRAVTSVEITAESTPAGGRFNSITAAQWNSTTLDAESIGTFKITGLPAAGLMGNIDSSTFTIRGNAGGLAIGTLSATGAITSDTFVLSNGGVTSFTATREVSNSTILLQDPLLGNLKTFASSDWQNTDLTARTIGTLKITGAPQVAPASPLLAGDLADSTIFAFIDSGTAPAIGTLSVASDLDTSTVIARHGITTLKVGHQLVLSTVVADDRQGGQVGVGRLGTVTIGFWSNSNVTATTMGRVSIIGYPDLGGPDPITVFGGLSNSTLLATGASPAGAKNGIDSFSALGSVTGGNFFARAGIGSFTVRGGLQNSALIFDDPLNVSSAGKVGLISAGNWLTSSLRANVVTTLQTVASAKDSALGDFDNTAGAFPAVTIAGAAGPATDPVGLTTFSVAHDLSGTEFNIPAGVKTIKVAGVVSDSDLAVGFAANARIASITAAAWENTDLTAHVVSAMNITGSATRFLAGNVSDSLLTITSQRGGVGLGKFSAQGTISGSTFQVTDGSVSSFTAGRFLESNLFAGFRPDSAVDLTQGGTFTTTLRTISLFKTTQPFDPGDPDSVSFAKSNVVAGNLGAITLTGGDPNADRGTFFGVGFKDGGAQGTVKTDFTGVLGIVSPPATLAAFVYQRL